MSLVSAMQRKRRRTAVVSGSVVTARKPTHVAQKEEKAALLEAVKNLRLQMLQLQASEVTRKRERVKEVAKALNVLSTSPVHHEIETSLLRDAVRAQQLSIAHVQSAVSSYVSTQERIPHDMNVCLGTDPKERRNTLISLKPRKIRAALEYMSARTRFLDPFRSFAETSRYLLDNGDYCALLFDHTALTGADTSVWQVFDALRNWVRNAEMLVTDELDDITTRDETVYDDGGIQHNHYISKLSTGVTVEMNTITNLEFVAQSDDHADGGPLGVLTEDFVDRDDLFPYCQGERVRHDATVVITVRSHSRKQLNPVTGELEDQTVVTLTRGCLLKLHKPQMQLPAYVEHRLREGITHWPDVNLATVIEQVYSCHSPSIAPRT